MNSPINLLKMRNLFGILSMLLLVVLLGSLVTAVAEQHPLQLLLSAL